MVPVFRGISLLLREREKGSYVTKTQCQMAFGADNHVRSRSEREMVKVASIRSWHRVLPPLPDW